MPTIFVITEEAKAHNNVTIHAEMGNVSDPNTSQELSLNEEESPVQIESHNCIKTTDKNTHTSNRMKPVISFTASVNESFVIVN